MPRATFPFINNICKGNVFLGKKSKSFVPVSRIRLKLAMAAKKAYYAVQNGRQKGVFDNWVDCKKQVSGYQGALYRKLDSYIEAKAFANGEGRWKRLGKSQRSEKARIGKKSTNKATAGSKIYSVKSSNPKIPSKIFKSWPECERYVKGQRGLSFKGFFDEASALGFINGTGNETVDYKHIGVSKEDFESKYKLNNSILYDEKCNVYCDGSALSNGRSSSKAGYGVYFENESVYNISQPLETGPQTNNRAEIQAVSSALEKIWEILTTRDKKKNYRIKTDSEYVSKLLNDRYTTYDDKKLRELPNGDLALPLIKRFAQVRQFYQINKECFANGGKFIIEWVKGHAGEEGNEMADELARQGAAKGRC
ncbi:RNH1 (YMR234W) [Zygosaccharomyces parabailii]|nr:RNH1 (YMR234W) [Zygosaccharomyces parabailii]